MTSEIHELFKQSRRPTAKHEHYFAIYDELFAPYKGRDVTFVEIGISGGGSLEAWRKYFGPKARIIGIDLNPALKVELEKDGLEVFIGDQADPAFWRSFYDQVGTIDVLLDDGGHTNSQTWTTVTQSLAHVRDGGLIVVEDTHTALKAAFGNPSRSSLIHRMFAAVHEINYRSPELAAEDRALRSLWERRLLAGLGIAERVYAVRFYESVVALSIDAARCALSQRTFYGSAENLPGGIHPEDFRTHGIRETLTHRIRGRIQRLRSRLPF